jgi:hypothetical protein
VIWESADWKEPLLRSADYLARVRLDDRTTGRKLVRIEKELFIGFYAIRKLLEGFKVSDSTKAMSFTLACYPSRRIVDYMNWEKIDDNYDLSKPKSEIRDITFLCNQFIHSYVFLPSDRDGKLDGVYVASDRARNEKCYFVSRDQFLSAFRTVGRDYPSSIQLERDPVTRQWKGSAW